MTTNKEITTVLTREEMFAKSCKIYDLRREYPGYDGKIFWAIATSYTNAELHLRFSELIAPYEPFILLSDAEGQVFKDYKNNEKKHSWRNTNCVDAFGYVDGDMELFHPELVVPSFEDTYIQSTETKALYELLLKLTEKQRKHILLHYINGYSIRQIASDECVNHKTICESITSGMNKLKKILKNTPPNELSHWE